MFVLVTQYSSNSLNGFRYIDYSLVLNLSEQTKVSNKRFDDPLWWMIMFYEKRNSLVTVKCYEFMVVSGPLSL